ncbi:hypothetical protein Misp01_35760 [Microtetraspora sp. NBRC 13810]|uniref:hypothetical protein n=1 Tax=Microtetraspora sp. NBRC 13810 TaxID=3030990 RepID=UPI0024A27264|nr:hypothetical protein [Microtetraspora sp. NBRC 13810]GLW08446.1 hypothetical protein Misp01_35760 [Microtetraspora sp. NBRC 13810]
MIKKLCVTGAVITAAAGVTLLATPAHADDWDNWSNNSRSLQSGNLFGNVANSNIGSGESTNVNNVNGIASTARNGSAAVTFNFR